MEKAIEKAKAAYRQAQKNADNKTCYLLEGIFGADTLRPKDVKDRIKTFEGAVDELGESHQLVIAYNAIVRLNECSCDIRAYLQLRIIVAALNEGWQPQFTKDEFRYYPWFALYTHEEICNMAKSDKKELFLLCSTSHGGAYCGLDCVTSRYDFSRSHFAARLALKNRELAIYCGKQFINICKSFVTI